MDSSREYLSVSKAARLLHTLYLTMVEAANPARVLPPHLPVDRRTPLRVIGALIGAPLVRDTRIKDEIAAQTIPHRKLGSHEPEATEGDAIKAQVAVV